MHGVDSSPVGGSLNDISLAPFVPEEEVAAAVAVQEVSEPAEVCDEAEVCDDETSPTAEVKAEAEPAAESSELDSEPASAEPASTDSATTKSVETLGLQDESPTAEMPVAESTPTVPSESVSSPDATIPETFVEVPVPATMSVPSEKPSVAPAATDSSSASSNPVAAANEVSPADIGVSPPESVTEPESGFRLLNLHEDVQRAIDDSGYTTPTDIQAEIIPHVLDGRDVLAQSQTGTGKTAAFALPILSKLRPEQRKPQVLVLAPTRELAIQVARSFETYGKFVRRFDVAAIYGGSPYDAQLRQLKRGVPVVVGTPGRVIDHIKRGSLDLSEISCLVLDEADEMLNMGFLEDVQFVLEQTPDSRQVALFSATLPAPIRAIADRYLTDPVRVTIKRKTMTAEAIRQRAVIVQHRHKPEVLSRILEVEETDGVIVFTKTREATTTVAEHLTGAGFSAVAMNGDMPQAARERTIAQLKNGRLDVLVATDVAARGLDVSRVSHVINYDVPQDTESYIHRIGRTGRAGRSGDAIILLSNSQRYKLKHIERLTKQRIELVPPPSVEQINEVRVQRFKDQIAKTAESADLALFQQIIADYSQEKNTAPEIIAAALAHMSQQGRPLLVEQLSGRDDRGRHNDRDDRGHRRDGDRRDRTSRNERYDDRRNDRSERQPRRSGRVESGMDRYRIEVGCDDGVKPGNIVGAVANEAGIEGRHIGPINIFDSYSTIDLPEGMPRDIYETLQGVRVAGKQLRLRKATEKDNHGERGSGPGGDGRKFKPRFSKRNGKGGKPKHGKKRRA